MFSKYYLRRGWRKYTQRSFESAINASRKVRSVDLDVMAEAKRLEGLCYYKMRVYDLAIFAFQRAIEITNYKTDWFNLSMCLAKKGETEKANRAFQNIYMAKTLIGFMRQISIPEMLFQFSRVVSDKKDFDTALKRITELKQMYIGANTTNTEFLSQKGLPSLNAFNVMAKKVLKGASHPHPEKWLSELPQ